MYLSFEIAALFSSPNRRVKKRGNFKTNVLVDFIESFLYCLSSSISSKFLGNWLNLNEYDAFQRNLSSHKANF